MFRASENTTAQERETTITISNGDAGAEVKVYVHQPFTTTFSVDSTSFEVAMEGGTKTVNVESNISYDVSIPSDCNWITLQNNSRSRTRSSKSSALIFKISKNTSGKERSATVTIGNSSLGVSKAVSFKQKFETIFGTATITVKSSDGKYSDKCNITVEIPKSKGNKTESESADNSDSGGSSDDNATARVHQGMKDY